MGRAKRALALAFTLLLASPLVNAQTAAALSARVADLEKQLAAVQAEIALLRQRENAPAAQANVVTSATPSPSSSSSSSLLGATTVSGLIDVYYGYNFNQPHDNLTALRAFDGPTNQFALNLVELTIDKAPDPGNSRMGYHVGLGFGQAMNVVNSSEYGGLGFAQYLKEAYFSYLAPAGKGLQFDVGKFVTPHGAEVIETKDNWNYSRGLLFTYAIPYYHFGLRTRYAFNDRYSVTGFLVNGWNNLVDTNTGKTAGVSFAWNPTRKLNITQNYMAGPQLTGGSSHLRQLSDTVITYSPTAKLSLVSNFDYGRENRIATRTVFWTGAAQYIRYNINERYALAARYEYYNDHDGFTTGTAQHIHEITGTLQRLVANHLITRLEFRRDFSNRPVFTNGDIPVRGQNTITAGLAFAFDTRVMK
jgi:Putative beta-barrel porin-2, OmpL-like. bbp2